MKKALHRLLACSAFLAAGMAGAAEKRPVAEKRPITGKHPAAELSNSGNKDPFIELAEELSSDAKPDATPDAGKVSVGVGNFAYEDSDLLSPFSSMLRDELEVALAKTGRFKVVTRDRIADLQIEGKFQGKEILEPGTGVERVSVEGIKGIIRGRFYAAGDKITVYTELVWLEGGGVKKSKVSIPAGSVRAKIWPDPRKAGDMAQVVKPQNLEQSLANVQEVAGNRLSKVPKDFQVEVFTTDGKRAYAAGETVSFRVRSAMDCHIAVLCHQSDGTTVVLFPNRHVQNTLIPANKPIDIPGTHKSGFEIEIGPPFGSDVVEVIACSQASELHKTLARFGPEKAAEPFQVLTRGMAVKGIQSALGPAPAGDTPLQWGQDSMVVSTFPKP